MVQMRFFQVNMQASISLRRTYARVQYREIFSSQEFLECIILQLSEVMLINRFPSETKPRSLDLTTNRIITICRK